MLSHLLYGLPRNRLPAMDHVAAVAIRQFRVPMAIISLVTDEEVVFVGAQGLPDGYMPKDTTFCRMVSASQDVVVVEDTLADDLLCRNSAVIGPPHIRFFAGAPLLAETGKLGTVCIADTVPRQFGFGQRLALQHMARIATQEWDDRKSMAATALAYGV